MDREADVNLDSVLDTYEGHGKRLVKVRNPWGGGDRSEWQGKWSDGSKEWTPEVRLISLVSQPDSD